MKKIVLLFVALFMWTGFAFSQTVLYEDNLDSYTLDSFLAVDNPTWWTTWSGSPGSNEDIQIKNTFSNSAPMSGSADIIPGGATSSTDCILKLGDKVSGVFELRWMMYIETGKCGYYNIQHMEAPGTEWAFEIYFRTDGTLELLHSDPNNPISGTYPKDVFFEVNQTINLDADSIYLYINGELLDAWTFSDEAGSTGGTKQLGGVDFYAGAKASSGETAGYYIDDVYFAQIEAGNDPVITVDPVAMATWLVDGTTGTEYLTVTNTGLSDLDYNINIVYDVDALKSAPVQSGADNGYSVKRTLTHTVAVPSLHPGTPAPEPDATAVLHYDGDNANSIYWNTVPVTVTVAARFPNNLTLPYAGLQITSEELYVETLNAGSNAMKIKIYGMGPTTYEPGALLYEQDFTPMGASWETITLTNPVTVTGEDLWVGYQFTQLDAATGIPGADAGPADPNGDFLSIGVGWSHLAPVLDFNWNIRANLVGNPMFQWLTVNPMSGVIAPGANTPEIFAFDATTLALGQYGATVKFLSNDPANPILDVPVTLDVVGVGIDELGKLGVMIYPNPAKEKLNIVTNGTFNKVTISDISGKVVFNGNNKTVDVSALSNGIYFVKVQTTQGISNTKFLKN